MAFYQRKKPVEHIQVIDNCRTIRGRRVREFYDPRMGCIVTQFLDPPPSKEEVMAEKRKQQKRMQALQRAWEREEKWERFFNFRKRK